MYIEFKHAQAPEGSIGAEIAPYRLNSKEALRNLTQEGVLQLESNLGVIANGLKDFAKKTGQVYVPARIDLSRNTLEVHTDLATLRKFCIESSLMLNVKYREPVPDGGTETWPWELWCILPGMLTAAEMDLPTVRLYCIADAKDLKSCDIEIHMPQEEVEPFKFSVGLSPLDSLEELGVVVDA